MFYVVCCGWLMDACKALCRPIQSGKRLKNYIKDSLNEMGSHEVMVRLEQWHARKMNVRTEFMNFDRIQQALAGGQGNRRDISPYQVQIVMKLCKPKTKGSDKLIYNLHEMQKIQMEADQEMDDFAVNLDDDAGALESVTALKKLVSTVKTIHSNQREYWRDAMVTLTEIQDQTMQAQNRLQSITSRVDGMINDQ